MSKATYHVDVTSMIIEDDPEAQVEKILGRKTFSASTRDEANALREKFAESVLDHSDQSYCSTLWVLNDSKEWVELGTSAVCWSAYND